MQRWRRAGNLCIHGMSNALSEEVKPRLAWISGRLAIKSVAGLIGSFVSNFSQGEVVGDPEARLETGELQQAQDWIRKPDEAANTRDDVSTGLCKRQKSFGEAYVLSLILRPPLHRTECQHHTAQPYHSGAQLFFLQA